MAANKRPFNKRAFTAIMSGLTALTLPFTGLVLHGYSEGAIGGDKHAWLMAHVLLGVAFRRLRRLARRAQPPPAAELHQKGGAGLSRNNSGSSAI